MARSRAAPCVDHIVVAGLEPEYRLSLFLQDLLQLISFCVAGTKPGCTPAGGSRLLQGPVQDHVVEWLLAAGVEHELALSCGAGRQRCCGGQPRDGATADAALEVIHRTKGGRQVDSLPGPAIASVDSGRRMIRTDLDRGRPDQHPASVDPFTNLRPYPFDVSLLPVLRL